MEAELHVNGQTVPGLARSTTATRRWPAGRTTASAARPRSTRGCSTPAAAAAPTGLGERVTFGLTTSIQSVGEGNYGRLGAGQQGRYTHALADPMFAEPATGGTPDEQPGAMPEIFPSPDQGANIDRCWTCRSMFMQAWGNYGTAWAVVHQWLGVRPDLGRGSVTFVPQVPDGQTRAGQGHPARTRICRCTGDPRRQHLPHRDRHRSAGGHPQCGHRPHLAARRAPVDSRAGRPGHYNYTVTQTNRGAEVTVSTGNGHHTLTITV